MKKVCIFNGDMSRGGGTEKITEVLANLLIENTDYDVSVLNLDNKSGKSYFKLDEKINFLILKRDGLKNKIIELTKLLRHEKFDVLINVDIMLAIYALPALFFNPKTKLVSWEMFNLRNDIGSSHTEMIRKICLRKSAYYVNQTKGDMDAFLAEMPVKCPIEYIYNPVDLDLTYEGYDENSKTIVTAGHFFKTKGFDLAVETAKYVFARHPDWKWEFYGDGVEMENIKELIKKYSLQDNVILCGRSSNMPEVYKKASMYVMTSRTEGFGLVLTEAKSFNLPTLSFDIDFGPREIIDDNVSGYLVKDFNTKELADKICELIENKEKRLEFSKKAKDNCDKFSSEAFVTKWIQTLEKI